MKSIFSQTVRYLFAKKMLICICLNYWRMMKGLMASKNGQGGIKIFNIIKHYSIYKIYLLQISFGYYNKQKIELCFWHKIFSSNFYTRNHEIIWWMTKSYVEAFLSNYNNYPVCKSKSFVLSLWVSFSFVNGFRMIPHLTIFILCLTWWTNYMM